MSMRKQLGRRLSFASSVRRRRVANGLIATEAEQIERSKVKVVDVFSMDMPAF